MNTVLRRQVELLAANKHPPCNCSQVRTCASTLHEAYHSLCSEQVQPYLTSSTMKPANVEKLRRREISRQVDLQASSRIDNSLQNGGGFKCYGYNTGQHEVQKDLKLDPIAVLSPLPKAVPTCIVPTHEGRSHLNVQ